MRQALIISFVEWQGAFQRPQHLALGLARTGWAVTYAAPAYLHRGRSGIGSGLTLPRHFHVAGLPALPGGSRSGLVERLNLAWMGRSLERLGRRRAPQGWDVVIFNDPRFAPLAARIKARRRIFDCMDDLSALTPRPGAYASALDEAVGLADRIWTGTWSLAERLKPAAAALGKRAQFIPCGVEAAHFSRAHPLDAEEAALLPPGEGPLAGYFGMINERFAMDRVHALLHAGWRVLLIGPVSSRAPEMPADPRCRWIGPRPYADLPSWLARFDLALIPYDISGPHRFLYPVKALEYLAGGKPVLSTPLPDVVRFLNDYVELADTSADWLATGEALLYDRTAALSRAEAGRVYAESRSWATMLAEMAPDLADGGEESA